MYHWPLPQALKIATRAGFVATHEDAYYDDDDNLWILFTKEDVIAVYEDGRINICEQS